MKLSAVLFPGVCLTKFLRDENDCFEPGRLFVSRAAAVPEEIPENTFVFLRSACPVLGFQIKTHERMRERWVTLVHLLPRGACIWWRIV